MQGREVRVGLIASVAPPAASMVAFRNELRERGYIEGQNLFIDVRWPRGSFEKNPDIALELVQWKSTCDRGVDHASCHSCTSCDSDNPDCDGERFGSG